MSSVTYYRSVYRSCVVKVTKSDSNIISLSVLTTVISIVPFDITNKDQYTPTTKEDFNSMFSIALQAMGADSFILNQAVSC